MPSRSPLMLRVYSLVQLSKKLFLIYLVFSSIFSVEAEDYKFENIKFDQVKDLQNTYQPKDKLDE